MSIVGPTGDRPALTNGCEPAIESGQIRIKNTYDGDPFPQRRAAGRQSRLADRSVFLNLRERDHHHRWIDRTLVKSGMCIEALRIV